MKIFRAIIWYSILGIIALNVLSCSNATDAKEPLSDSSIPKIFKLLLPSETNINFGNYLEEGLNTNILMYEYFYNGGGVACGDFNGDSILDLYFTSNMGDNKLYLNKGLSKENEVELQYIDVSLESKASGRTGPWKTGVNVIDINSDGKLDIYLCYSGAMPAIKRKNQLFVNQGNNNNGIPVFEDLAEEYGLASEGFSNQSYFFDYDKDGDLDMILLNHNPKNLPILNEVKTKELLSLDDPMKGIRLYRQDNNHFSDQTPKSGINGSELSYGLGVGISDINNDGWPDFYVSNDYSVPDYLYINNKNGTFTNTLPESIGHNSQFSMGNDIADINGDGNTDIVTLDMLPNDNERQKLLLAPDNYSKYDLNVRSGFNHQIMRNMLQLNNGNGTFSEIGQLAGISNTDWSWAALLADYDNDGFKDLFVTNGYNKDYTNLDFISYMDGFVKSKGRLNRENVVEIIGNMPASDVKNYIYKGHEQATFKNVTNEWGMGQISNSNGAIYADLDMDGDLDIVVNNVNKEAFLYENQADKISNSNYLNISLKGIGQNISGIGAKLKVFSGNKIWVLEQFPARGYLSAVTPLLHVGLGNASIDSIEIIWPSNKSEKLKNITPNQTLLISESNATFYSESIQIAPKTIFNPTKPSIEYIHPEIKNRDFDRQGLLLNEQSFTGPVFVKADINNDGLEDVFIGGAQGESASIYFKNKNGSFQKSQNKVFEIDKDYEDTDALFFDCDLDGDLDLYVASGGYHNFSKGDLRLQDRFYINNGKGAFERNTRALPEMYSSSSTIVYVDINKDSYPDLFVGSCVVPGRFPEAHQSFILINDGKGNFEDKTAELAPDFLNLGIVTDAKWIDLDQNGQGELVIVGNFMPILIYNFDNGMAQNVTDNFLEKQLFGLWNKIEIGDFNKDGQNDLVFGNIGTNVQFHVSDSEPGELIFKDFDGNGSVDPIFSYYMDGISYPYMTRDELQSQLSLFRAKYTTYKSYSKATTKEILSSLDIKGASILKINELRTGILLSNGVKKYNFHQLPIETQYSSIHTINAFDYNKDGNLDLLLCGNNSHMKLSIGKLDANYGIVLEGLGNGKFNYVSQKISGLNLSGDVRSVLQLDQLFLFGINGRPLISKIIN